MERSRAVLAAVQRIYDAVLEPDGWSVALDSLAAAGAGRVSLFFDADIASGRASIDGAGVDPGALARFGAIAGRGLPDWVDAIPTGAALPQTAFVADHEFERSDFYREAVSVVGGFYAIVAPIVRSPARRVYVTVGRDLGEGDFSGDDVAAIQAVVPHLATAARLRRHMDAAGARAAAAEAALDRLEAGVVLVDAALRAVFVNARAEALAGAADGLSIVSGRVRAALPAETRALERALAAAVARVSAASDAPFDPPGRVVISRPSGRRPLVAAAMPVRPPLAERLLPTRGLAALFLVEPERPPAIDVVALGQAFDLAPREAELAALLARGSSLAEAAAALGIAGSTARWYVQRVLEKSGTHRQSALVALVLRGFSGPMS